MDPPENELDIVKRKIAAIEVKLARAEAERDNELIVVYEKLLAGLQEEENILSQAAERIRISTIDILLSKMETMSTEVVSKMETMSGVVSKMETMSGVVSKMETMPTEVVSKTETMSTGVGSKMETMSTGVVSKMEIMSGVVSKMETMSGVVSKMETLSGVVSKMETMSGVVSKMETLSTEIFSKLETLSTEIFSKLETISAGIEALLKYNEDKKSVSGSECRISHYYNFGFGELTPPFAKNALDYAATRQEFLQIKTCVTQYTQRIRCLYRAKKTDEVMFVQPLSRNLLKELAQAVGMGGDTEVQHKNHSLAVEYDSKEYHIHGEMDAGLFLKGTRVCLCPWEDKDMSNEWSWKYVTQCAAEMAGKLEHLKSGYDFIPKRYCGIVTNGRWWVIVFRYINSEGRRFWLHTTPIQAIDIAGNIIPRGVYQVIILLFHAMMISKEVMKALFVQIRSIFDVEKSGRHIDKYSPREDASSDDDDVKTHSSEGGNIARPNERGRHGENGGKQSGGHQHAGQKYALQDIGNTCSPLTVSNIAAHGKLVPKKNVFTEIGLRDY